MRKEDDLVVTVTARPKFFIKILTTQQKLQMQETHQARIASLLKASTHITHKDFRMRDTIAMPTISCIQVTKSKNWWATCRSNIAPLKKYYTQRAKTNSISRQDGIISLDTGPMNSSYGKIKKSVLSKPVPKSYQTLKVDTAEASILMCKGKVSETPKYKLRRWYDVRPRLILKSNYSSYRNEQRKDFSDVRLALAIK
eukprot:TRINITY_DN7048_c0_g3_i1.p1 TRINITY_DN7048_c0_g3~~TRINITY_DN7048_c0_g3_i1.p1  ORF type:complete len:198 (-),score=16.93 TRINITY_DN7048_c0_g3_i1:74-667(-)